MNLTKRGFLKVAGGVAGALGLQLYSEPLIAIPKRHEWIEDRGDFYIVRVPSGKSFVNEHLDKPTIFQAGERSHINNVKIDGYVNLYFISQLSAGHITIDASRMSTQATRPALKVQGHLGYIDYLNITGNGVCSTWEMSQPPGICISSIESAKG
jgi:hypothetical protein